MASSHVYVVDSSFKRTQIKVSPGKYMREVLEEACKSRKLNPESYTLKTQNNKVVDLSQPFRLSGLSAGAKLQLTQGSRSPSVVSVALQLPESEGGTRLADKFPSTTSLWLILRKFEDAVAGQPPRKLNLTQRAVPLNIGSGSGRLEYEQPCLHLVSRNMETFADLQKTLGQLGLTGGNVLIRLSFKSSGQPLEEAMQKMEQYFSSVPSDTGSSTQAGAHAAPVSQLHSQPDASAPNAAVPQEGAAGPEPAEVDDTPMADVNKLPSPGDAPDVIAESSKTDPQPVEQATSTINGMTVFRPPSSNTPAAALQQDDPSVFEPSVDQAKAHQASLLRSSRNQRLLSDKELEDQEAERTARLANVQTVVVRVRYPDQSQIETTVDASETSAALYAKVMDTLACAPEPFELRYSGGPKGHHETLPNSSARKLVRDFGFRGKVLVTLVWSPDASARARQGPVLKAEYLRHARDLKVDLAAQQAAGEGNHRAAMAGNDAAAGSSSSSSATAGGSKGKGDLEAKMKKFLGFGKK